MIERVKIEAVEDKQLPRWVYAMMKANQDPNAADDGIADNPRLRHMAKLQAENFYKKRQERIKAQADANESSRYSGLEWKTKPKNKFTEDELRKVLPGGAAYVANKSFLTSFVMLGVIAATLVTIAIGVAICAEIRLNVSAGTAWRMFVDSPTVYYHHVIGAFSQPD